MGLPRWGFLESSTAAAYLGPGPGKKTSARLAYGPGPGGSFESFCGAALMYELPPLHVYKERSTFFTISPCKDRPPGFKRPVYKPPPPWADRLCMTPGQAAQFKKDGAMTWKGKPGESLVRPASASALISRLPKTKSTEQLLRGVDPEAKIALGCGGVYIIPPHRSLSRPGTAGSRPGTADKFASSSSGFSSPIRSPDGMKTSPSFGKLTR